MTSLSWLIFLIRSLTVTLIVIWISFFLLMLVFVLVAFPPLGNSDHVVVLVPIDFPINSKQDSSFHCIA